MSVTHVCITPAAIGVTASLDGWVRTVTLTETIVYPAPARMQAPVSTSSMVSPASVGRVLEVRYVTLAQYMH